MFKKHLCLILTSLLIFIMFPLCVHSDNAAIDTLVDMNNQTTITNAGAAASNQITKSAANSAYWGNQTKNTKISFDDVPRDFSRYIQLEMWIYSAKATNSDFIILLNCDQAESSGASYYYIMNRVDWQGWKSLTVSISSLNVSRSAKLTQVNNISFCSNGWDMVPNAETELYIDSIFGVMEISNYGSSVPFPSSLQNEFFNMTENLVGIYNDSENVMVQNSISKLDESGAVTVEHSGVSMVPLSFFEQFLGCETVTTGVSHTITNGANTISAEVGGTTLSVNGKSVVLTSSPTIIDGFVYVPVRQYAEALGMRTFAKDGLTLIGGNEVEIFKTRDDLAEFASYYITYMQITEASSADFEAVKNKWRARLVGQNNDLTNSYVNTFVRGITTAGRNALNGMRRDGSIPWGTVSDNASHLETIYLRIYRMAAAYSIEEGSLYHNAALKEGIIYALNWAYDNVYGANVSSNTNYGNWWYWTIGAPMYLIDTLILMENELASSEILKYLEPVDIILTAPSMTGANRSDIIYNLIGAALLEEDLDKLIAARDGLDGVFRYAESGDGFYRDGSFIQHDKVPYVGVYGTILLTSLTRTEVVLEGSKFEICNPQKGNLSQWIFQSVEPFIYKGGMMSMVKGRGPDGGHDTGATIVRTLLSSLELFGEEDAERIKSMIKYYVREDTSVDYYLSMDIDNIEILQDIMNDSHVVPREDYTIAKVYGNMDRVVQHKDDYAFGISMSSERIINYESVNAANMKGWYSGDGMVYLYNDDLTQYEASYWNYVNRYRMPGVTADTQTREEASILNSEAYLSSQDFVGGVSYDGYAAAAMHLESYHSEGGMETTTDWSGGGAPAHACNLEAQKAWFMFDEELVALGTGIRASNDVNVETTIENRKTPVSKSVVVDGESMPTVSNYQNVKEAASWAYIEQAGGYYFPEKKDLNIRRNPSGSGFVELWYDHGVNPANEGYSYVMLPNKSAVETSTYAKNPDIEIMQNTQDVQAVSDRSTNMTGVVFWNSGTFEDITVSNPLILMMQDTEAAFGLSVSDPTHKLTTATIEIRNKHLIPENISEKVSVSYINNNTVLTVQLADSKGATELMLFSVLEKTPQRIAELTKAESIASMSLTADGEVTLSGALSAKWVCGDLAETVRIESDYSDDNGFSGNVSAYSAVNLWMYLPKAYGSNVSLIMQGDQSSVNHYFIYQLMLDWTGWKQVTIPLCAFERVNNPTWTDIRSFRISAFGWPISGLPDNAATIINIDSIWLSGDGSSDNTFTVAEFSRKEAATLRGSAFTSDSEATRMYERSAKWKLSGGSMRTGYSFHAKHGEIPSDWSQYGYLNLWMYSPQNYDAKFNIVAYHTNTIYRFKKEVTLSEGWRLLSIPLSEFEHNGIRNWADISYLTFNSGSWGGSSMPDYGIATVNFDKIWLSATVPQETMENRWGTFTPKHGAAEVSVEQNKIVLSSKTELCESVYGTEISVQGHNAAEYFTGIKENRIYLVFYEPLNYDRAYNISVCGGYQVHGAALLHGASLHFTTQSGSLSISEPVFTDASGKSCEVLPQSGSVKVSAILQNAGPPTTVDMLVGLYRGENQLVKLVSSSYRVSESEKDMLLEASIDSSSYQDCSVKVFLWDDRKNMVPYMPSTPISALK